MGVEENRKLILLSYGPIYYFSFLFGVMPFKYSGSAAAEDSAFKPFMWGTIYCYLMCALNLYTGFDILRSTITAFRTYESCFDEFCSINMCRNVCAHFTILWMNYIANFVSSWAILYIRRERTLQCLNGVHNLLKARLYAVEFSFSAWSILFFMIVNWSAFFFHWKNTFFAFAFIRDYLPLYVMQCLPVVTENLVSTLLLVTEHSFRDLNRRIEELSDQRFFLRTQNSDADTELVAASLRHLKEYYWKCADSADHISDCFGVDFLVAGFCSAIRFIYFLFLTLKYAAEQSVVSKDGGFVLPRQEAFVFFLAVVGKFYYLCYRCDGVVSEAEKIVPNLFTWRNSLRFTSNQTNHEQVEEFLNLIKCRVISFDACNFFTLNLHLICSVFGLTVTYFIVLMQFQASHSV